MESRWRDASFVFFFVESCFQRVNVNRTRVCVCARTRVTHKRMLVISVHEQPTVLRSWCMLSNVCKCIHVEDTSFDLQNVWLYICFQLWNINRLWQKDCVATCVNIYVSQKSKIYGKCLFVLWCENRYVDSSISCCVTLFWSCCSIPLFWMHTTQHESLQK
jgi:hypothetical protein